MFQAVGVGQGCTHPVAPQTHAQDARASKNGKAFQFTMFLLCYVMLQRYAMVVPVMLDWYAVDDVCVFQASTSSFFAVLAIVTTTA